MSLRGRIFIGSIWAATDRFGTVFLQFIVNLVLARLLMPSDYGCIGMLTIFIVVAQVLIDGGFGSALIQKKNPTQEDYSTIFYWNLCFSILLYIILFFLSPLIAHFFRIPLLKQVLRVLGIILVINSFSIIQSNRLRKQLALGKIAFANVSALFGASIVGIVLAYHGYGVWSLVIIQLLYAFFVALILWFVAKWYPSFCFSLKSLKSLFGFGGYLLLSNILQEICRNLQGIIIGRKFSSTEMGLYAQAKKLDDVVSQTLPNIIVQVMYPVYSQIQDDLERTQAILRLNIRVISFVTFPVMLLLILIAHPLIEFLFGSKWDACVPYFQILCIGGLFICLQNINYYAVAAQGKSKALLIWSFYKWSMLLTLLLIGMHWGMNGILWGMVVSSLNIYLVNAALVAKYVSYSMWRQFQDILPVLLVSIITYWIVFMVEYYAEIHFLYQVILFVIIYLLSVFFSGLPVKKDISMIIRALSDRQK